MDDILFDDGIPMSTDDIDTVKVIVVPPSRAPAKRYEYAIDILLEELEDDVTQTVRPRDYRLG